MKVEFALPGTRFAVLGFGRAGRAATDFLRKNGGQVDVYAESPVEESVRAYYEHLGVRFRTGPFPERFEGDVLIRSPGIRPDIPPILASLAAGAVLSGESELFFAHCKGTIIAVTGSDGKTTTAALIAALLAGTGKRVLCGGNNGIPLLPRAEELFSDDFAVVELSSFQLMTLDISPAVSVVTNITPNHLNWHFGMEEYVAAKCRIFQNAGRLVTNADCPVTAELARQADVPVTLFASSGEFPPGTRERIFFRERCACLRGGTYETEFDCGHFSLPGKHNRENLMAALAAVSPFIRPGTVPAVLSGFRGVAHRLQYVDTVNGVAYYNSSIDTSPSRTAAALAALGGTPVVIAGGRGKGVPLAPLAETLAARAKAVCLYGETAKEISEAIRGRIPVVVYTGFREAFSAATRIATPGDSVLLSPGCTAFGEFRDFEERGEVFMKLVSDLPR